MTFLVQQIQVRSGGNRDLFKNTADRVEAFETSDGHSLTTSAANNLVAAMASMLPPPIGQTQLSTNQHNQIDPVLAANWQQHT